MLQQADVFELLRNGLQNNFITIVIEDCGGDRNLNSHEANLHDLNTKYADIVQ